MIFNSMKKYSKIKFYVSGFTLVETMVAVGILAIAFLAPMTFVAKSISAASISQSKTTAFYLAQEGMEFIKNTRDNNKRNNIGWLTGLDNCMAENNATGCYVADIVDVLSVSPCDSELAGGCPVLKYDGDTGKYNYDSGQDSPFKRSIVMTQVSGNVDEYEVKVTVTWKNRGMTTENQTYAQYYLFNR